MIKRVSETKCVVSGNPTLSMSPEWFWKIVDNGEQPVFTDSGHPITYCVETGKSVDAASLEIEAPVVVKTNKKEEGVGDA